MADDAFDFDMPADGSSKLSFSNLEGQLVLISASRVEAEIQTTYGVKSATVVDCHVIETGEVYRDKYAWPSYIQDQLRTNVGSGRFVLGRVGKGKNVKAGQTPPWRLNNPTDEDQVMARKYLAGLKKGKASKTKAADDEDFPFESE
jgi:hypothetical protein